MTRASYKLRNHEYTKSHVEISHDENGMINLIEFWSYSTMVACAYKAKVFERNENGESTFNGVYKWVLKCTGTYSVTTSRQLTWFTNMPYGSKSKKWVLSRALMVDVYKHDWHIKDANEDESANIEDLIRWYIYNGTKCHIYG